MKIICPNCSAKYQIKELPKGKGIKCQKCKTLLGTKNIQAASVESSNKTSKVKSSAAEDDILNNTGDNRYRIRNEIARGGMGAILKTKDESIRRDVAMKVMLKTSSEQEKARFVDEAQITGQLEHPNIVPVHDLGVDKEGKPFFTMKLVHGKSLKEIIDVIDEGDDSYSMSNLVDIFKSICNAVAFAHSRKVIHRDLKPANVMVGDFGEVMLMDWGLAKSILSTSDGKNKNKLSNEGDLELAQMVRSFRADDDSDQTMDGKVMGTPAFMPPEQAKGEVDKMDERSDIYSLGAILYALLALRSPLSGDVHAILKKVVTGKIKPPEKNAPKGREIPSELSAIAMKAMSRNRGQRYKNVKGLTDDLELYQEGRAVSAKSDSLRETVTKFVQRNKAVVVGVCMFLLALVGGLVIAVAGWSAAESSRIAAQDAEKEAVKAGEVAKKAAATAEMEKKKAELEKVKAQEAEKVATEANSAMQKAHEATNKALELAREERTKAIASAEEARLSLQQYEEEKNKRFKDRISTAPTYLANAQKAAGQKDFDQAFIAVQEALSRDPKLKDARMLLAQLHIQNKNYDKASNELEAYIKIDNSNENANDLLRITQRSKSMKPDELSAELAKVLIKQKAYVFAEASTLSKSESFEIWKGRLNSAWKGSGDKLKPLPKNMVSLDLSDFKNVNGLQALKGMPIQALFLTRTSISNVDDLEGLPIQELSLSGTRVRNVSVLKKLPLKVLDISSTEIENLEGLSELSLESLNIAGSSVADLTPLAKTNLKVLDISNTGVSDLEPIKKLSLISLKMVDTKVSTIKPLAGMPLKVLDITNNFAISEIEATKGMPLNELYIPQTGVGDLTPLKRAQLKKFAFTPQTVKINVNVVKKPSLKLIGTSNVAEELLPYDEFWRKYKTMRGGVTKAQLNTALIAANPELILNSHTIKYTIEKDKVVGFEFDARHAKLFDVSPLAMATLTKLNVRNAAKVKGWESLAALPIENLTISRAESIKKLELFEEMPLKELHLYNATQISSLKPIGKMKLTALSLTYSQKLTSLQAVKNQKITSLNIEGCTKISSLKYIQSMKLTALNLNYCSKLKSSEVSSTIKKQKLTSVALREHGFSKVDFLKGLPLTRCDLREMPKLTTLNGIGASVRDLYVDGCKSLEDIDNVSKMKSLSSLSMNFCTSIKTMNPIRGLRIRYLNVLFCSLKNMRSILLSLDELSDRSYGAYMLRGDMTYHRLRNRLRNHEVHMAGDHFKTYAVMLNKIQKEEGINSVVLLNELVQSKQDKGEIARCAKLWKGRK